MILHLIKNINIKPFIKILILIYLFVQTCSSFANDIYDANKNILEINRVKVNDSIYYGIKLNPDKIISLTNERSVVNFDVFDAEKGILFIPSVSVEDKKYKNVSITIGNILSIGGVNYSIDILDSNFGKILPVENNLEIKYKLKNKLDFYNWAESNYPSIFSSFGWGQEINGVYYKYYSDLGSIITIDSSGNISAISDKQNSNIINLRNIKKYENNISSWRNANPPLSCKKLRSENDLNILPVSTIYGLKSNWSNKDSVIGFSDVLNYQMSISNLAAVSLDGNDFILAEKVFNSIYSWASKDALLGTKTCTNPLTKDNMSTGCTEWQDPSGNDVSDFQTENFVVEAINSIRKSYYLLRPLFKDSESMKDKIIVDWLNKWEERLPVKNSVAFGLGMNRFQWRIDAISIRSGLQSKEGKDLIEKMMTGIVPLINNDGSLVDRTFRGSKAIWYHFNSINDIVTSIWYAKRAGVIYDEKITSGLHKAVEIFLNTLEDPSYIYSWAKAGLNNGGDPLKQEFFFGRPNDFDKWWDIPLAGSWIYLYLSWYPENNNSLRLSKILNGKDPQSAYQDYDFMPLGCLVF